MRASSRPALISPVVLPFSSDFGGNEEKYLEELKETLKERKISYTSVQKASDSVLIRLSGSAEVIISSRKDIKKEISSLQYILSHLTMEGKDFSRLDMRFDKPVIMLR